MVELANGPISGYISLFNPAEEGLELFVPYGEYHSYFLAQLTCTTQ
jgi:hypothetical protein